MNGNLRQNHSQSLTRLCKEIEQGWKCSCYGHAIQNRYHHTGQYCSNYFFNCSYQESQKKYPSRRKHATQISLMHPSMHFQSSSLLTLLGLASQMPKALAKRIVQDPR
uniref:Uncharacterized protein n=1 Tax=Populus davidiana TaxID=266767 RepID=A0A6M2EJ98_9ROSI